MATLSSLPHAAGLHSPADAPTAPLPPAPAVHLRPAAPRHKKVAAPPRRALSRRLWLRLPVLPFCAETLVRTTEQNGALWHLFDARDVPRFYALHKYTNFYWHGPRGPEEHMLVDSLDTLEARLAGHGFLRIQRAELINLRFLHKICTHGPRGRRRARITLELADGQHAVISRRRLAEVRKILLALATTPRLPRQLGVRALPV